MCFVHSFFYASCSLVFGFPSLQLGCFYWNTIYSDDMVLTKWILALDVAFFFTRLISLNLQNQVLLNCWPHIDIWLSTTIRLYHHIIQVVYTHTRTHARAYTIRLCDATFIETRCGPMWTIKFRCTATEWVAWLQPLEGVFTQNVWKNAHQIIRCEWQLNN